MHGMHTHIYIQIPVGDQICNICLAVRRKLFCEGCRFGGGNSILLLLSNITIKYYYSGLFLKIKLPIFT